ncbi:aldehyde dehydrogenase family protein, partial [Gorillibacterium massiliense]|uniref:aldehyde dehydrogenase family protein n=1 Tax=Gorillibacterium massiliense TaxID=1280390 RepID=UPI000592A4B7
MTETREADVRKIANRIGGKWAAPSSPHYEEVYNPATGKVIASVPLSGEADIKQAVTVASAAYEIWRGVPSPRRARCLFRYQQLLMEHTDELAAIITTENGKNL